MDCIRSIVSATSPAREEAHRIIRTEIPHLPHSELELRLLAFSLREIDRARQRINKIPELSPTEARALYYRLLRAFIVEHDTPDCAEPRSQRRAA